MIYKQLNETSGIFCDAMIITAVYEGARLVWEAVKCCFSKGYWINAQPWKNNEPWKNNT